MDRTDPLGTHKGRDSI